MLFGKLRKMINALRSPELQLQFETWLPFSSPIFSALFFFIVASWVYGAFCNGGVHASRDVWIPERQYFAFYFLKKWREPILNLQGPCLQTVWYSVQTQVGDLHNLCVADPVGLEQYICLDESTFGKPFYHFACLFAIIWENISFLRDQSGW